MYKKDECAWQQPSDGAHMLTHTINEIASSNDSMKSKETMVVAKDWALHDHIDQYFVFAWALSATRTIAMKSIASSIVEGINIHTVYTAPLQAYIPREVAVLISANSRDRVWSFSDSENTLLLFYLVQNRPSQSQIGNQSQTCRILPISLLHRDSL